ncbi:hypothetical protein Pfo_011641 [Paulownia fortunei]|nr:hypothetical protein Pfo_011641 [Paulownia fortunei]
MGGDFLRGGGELSSPPQVNWLDLFLRVYDCKSWESGESTKLKERTSELGNEDGFIESGEFGIEEEKGGSPFQGKKLDFAALGSRMYLESSSAHSHPHSGRSILTSRAEANRNGMTSGGNSSRPLPSPPHRDVERRSSL